MQDNNVDVYRHYVHVYRRYGDRAGQRHCEPSTNQNVQCCQVYPSLFADSWGLVGVASCVQCMYYRIENNTELMSCGVDFPATEPIYTVLTNSQQIVESGELLVVVQ